MKGMEKAMGHEAYAHSNLDDLAWARIIQVRYLEHALKGLWKCEQRSDPNGSQELPTSA